MLALDAIGGGAVAGSSPMRIRIGVTPEQSLPPPLAGGGWGRGQRHKFEFGADAVTFPSARRCHPSPNPLPAREQENCTPASAYPDAHGIEPSAAAACDRCQTRINEKLALLGKLT
jgi:hypothetical protein